MIWFFIGLGLLAGLIVLGKKLVHADPRVVARWLRRILFVGGILIALAFLARGAVFLALPIFVGALGLLAGGRRGSRTKGDGYQSRPRPPSTDMSVDDALDILGLEPGADARAVQEAHRRLLKATHPDHGGSDWLAARINRAKDVLLSSMADG